MEVLSNRLSPRHGLPLRCIVHIAWLTVLQLAFDVLRIALDASPWALDWGDEWWYVLALIVQESVCSALVLGLLAERLLVGPALVLTWGERGAGREDVEIGGKTRGTMM